LVRVGYIRDVLCYTRETKAIRSREAQGETYGPS